MTSNEPTPTLDGMGGVGDEEALEMRAGNQHGPQTAILDSLKFDLPCDLVIGLNVFRPIVLWRCNKPARWAARNQCCGEVLLSCRKHREALGKCVQCKLFRFLPRWSRI